MSINEKTCFDCVPVRMLLECERERQRMVQQGLYWDASLLAVRLVIFGGDPANDFPGFWSRGAHVLYTG